MNSGEEEGCYRLLYGPPGTSHLVWAGLWFLGLGSQKQAAACSPGAGALARTLFPPCLCLTICLPPPRSALVFLLLLPGFMGPATQEVPRVLIGPPCAYLNFGLRLQSLGHNIKALKPGE